MNPLLFVIQNLMKKVIPYTRASLMLAPLAKFIYSNTFGKIGAQNPQAINQNNYTDAVQQLQNGDIDFSSTLNQKKFSNILEDQGSNSDGKDLKTLLENLNLNYNTANKQDYFRGNYG